MTPKQRFPLSLMASSVFVTILICLWQMSPAWLINYSSLLLLKLHTEQVPDQSPLFGIGIRPPENSQNLSLSLEEENKSSVDIFNIHSYLTDSKELDTATVPIDEYERINALLEDMHHLNDKGALMKRAHLALLSGRYQKSLDYLRDLERDSVCLQSEIETLNCYALWRALGDALDGLGEPALALDYYQKMNWVGRREAAAFLALTLGQEADRDGNEQEAMQWNVLAAEILPDRLATAYASDSESVALRHQDNPHLLLKLGTDLRLERLNAEATVRLWQDGTWGQETFLRVLATRSWLVDIHTLDYHEYKIVWNWTPETPNIAIQMAGLLAYFERIVELIPEEGGAWYYLAETKARLGFCEEANLYYEQAEGARNSIVRSSFRRLSPCPEMMPTESILPPFDNTNFVVNMEDWRSYGQMLGLTAATSHQYGYERHAAWVWGPDKLYSAEGKTAFRADCLWSETSPDPTFLLLTLTDTKGRVALHSVPANRRVEVQYQWRTEMDVRLTPMWLEKSDTKGHSVQLHRSDTMNQTNGWHSTTLMLPPSDRERLVELQWRITGCGQVRLDNIAGHITIR